MPRGTPQTPQRADASRNREAVVEAAFEVLSRQPDAAMAEIATASGLGRTTLYRHFTGRDALIAALVERVFEESIAAIRAILAEADDPRTVLPRVAAETVALGDRYRFLAGHREVVEELRRAPREDPLGDWVERSIAAGTLRPLGRGWTAGMLLGLITAAHTEVIEGRERPADAARKLGETLVAAFVI